MRSYRKIRIIFFYVFKQHLDQNSELYLWRTTSSLLPYALALMLCLLQVTNIIIPHAGIISNGGTKANIIPKEASLEYFMWTPSDSEMNSLKQKFEACVEGAAKTTGCSFECVFTDKPYSSLLNNNVMASLYAHNGSSLGVQWESDPKLLNMLAGSTDMGNVSKRLPAIHPVFRAGNAGVHTAGFVNVAGSPDAQTHALTTGKALAMTAIDMFFQPELMLKVKTDFAGGLRDEQKRSCT